MKIGLLGGSFNPAHQGHIHISELAVKKLGLNQVWWIPTSQNPLKEKATEPYLARLQDCIKITQNHPKIVIKDFEKDSPSTYKIVKKIKAKHPEAQFYWIMGADNLKKFHLWKNFLPLIKSIEFAIFSRADFLLKAKETRAFRIYQNIFSTRNSKPSAIKNASVLKLLETKNNVIKSAQLPKFSLFQTKNYDISSGAIRNKKL